MVKEDARSEREMIPVRSTIITSSSTPIQTGPRCFRSAVTSPVLGKCVRVRPGYEGWCDISGGKIYDHSNKQVWQAPKGENGHANEHVDLFKAIRKGEMPNEGDYGATSTMTANMGRMASYSGKKLTWDDCFNSRVALPTSIA